MKRLCLTTILLLPVLVYSQEDPAENAVMKEYNRVMDSYKTSYSFFVKNNLPAALNGTLDGGLKNRLSKIKDLTYNGDIAYPQKNYNEKKVFDFYNGKNSENSGRVVLGFVRFDEFIQRTQVDTKNEGQYLIRKNKVQKLYFEVYLLNIKDKKVLISIKEECYNNNTEINKLLDKFSSKIEPFYPHIEKPIIPVIIEPEKIEPVKIEAIKVEPVKVEEPYKIYYRMSVTTVLPLSKYTHISYFGLGLNAGLTLEDKFFNNSVFTLDMSPSAGLSENKKISNYIFVPFSLHGGYLFQISNNFQLAPSVGGGYIFHFVDSKLLDFYYDPIISANIELRYTLSQNYFIFTNLGYTMFFEKVHNGSFASMNIGFSGRIK